MCALLRPILHHLLVVLQDMNCEGVHPTNQDTSTVAQKERTEIACRNEDSLPEPDPSVARGLSSAPLMAEPLSEAACSKIGRVEPC